METANIADIVKLLLPLLGLPIFIKIYRQHVLVLNLLWKKFIGKTPSIKNEAIRKTTEDQLDLANLRITYPKVHFQNIYHAEAIIKWCKSYRIGIDDISGLSHKLTYNEYENPKIKLNDKGIIFEKIMTIVFLLIFTFTFSLGAIAPPLSGLFGGIWLKLNTPDTYVWLVGTEKVQKITSDKTKPPAYYKANCDDEYSSVYGLSREDTREFCIYFHDEKKAAKYQESTLKKSMWLSIIICPIFAIAIFICILSFLKLSKLSTLSKQIKTKGLDPTKSQKLIL